MKRKGNKTTSSVLNSSSSSKQQTVTSYYLPDECWESIFRFIIVNDNNNDDYYSINHPYLNNNEDVCNNNNNNHYLSSLSLVSKQFLSITNRLLFSFSVLRSTDLHGLFKRFTNLNSLNIKRISLNLNKLLLKISRFPMKQLTSLNISNQAIFPTNGLRAFSQITTLTSLTCSRLNLNPSNLFLIAKCFPLLEQLDLSYPGGCKNYSSYVDGVEALSLELTKLRKVNLSGFPVNNQSFFHLFNNCRYFEEVIVTWCHEITSVGLASALHDKPTLRSLSFSMIRDREMFRTSILIDSLVSLKGLTCLVFHDLNISDELLYSIAREGLPLTRFVLLRCTGYSYAGIIRLLSKCNRIQHLDLQYTDFLKDLHVVVFSSFLVDLMSINLGHCHDLTKSAFFTLVKNCPSLSEIKMEMIGNKVAWNSDSFEEFGVYPQLKSLYLGGCLWLSDKIIIMFASNFPNLQLLDLNGCNFISEGICQVLRKCCKIRHLNLYGCSGVKRLGINFVIPNLQVLNLSSTEVGDETLYVNSKNCCGLSQLLLRQCNCVTEKAVRHLLENCTQLREVVGRDLHLSEKNMKLVGRNKYIRR